MPDVYTSFNAHRVWRATVYSPERSKWASNWWRHVVCEKTIDAVTYFGREYRLLKTTSRQWRGYARNDPRSPCRRRAFTRVGRYAGSVSTTHWSWCFARGCATRTDCVQCCIVFKYTILWHNIWTQSFLHRLNYALYMISQYEHLVRYWKTNGFLVVQCSRTQFAEPSWPVESNAWVLRCVKYTIILQIVSKHFFLHSIDYIIHLISQCKHFVLFWKRSMFLFMYSVQEHNSLNLVDQ
jgi:hypothetical protein